MKQSIVRYLDALFTKYIKLRANGRCEFCGKHGTDTGHVFVRSHKWLRWEPLNAFWLCRECHLVADKNRKELKKKVREIHGEDQFIHLWELSLKSQPMYESDTDKIKTDLLDLIKEIS